MTKLKLKEGNLLARRNKKAVEPETLCGKNWSESKEFWDGIGNISLARSHNLGS